MEHTTVGDLRKLIEGLPDDALVLVHNSECVISDPSPEVQEVTVAGDFDYFWKGTIPDGDLDEEAVNDQGFALSDLKVYPAVWINADEP